MHSAISPLPPRLQPYSARSSVSACGLLNVHVVVVIIIVVVTQTVRHRSRSGPAARSRSSSDRTNDDVPRPSTRNAAALFAQRCSSRPPREGASPRVTTSRPPKSSGLHDWRSARTGWTAFGGDDESAEECCGRSHDDRMSTNVREIRGSGRPRVRRPPRPEHGQAGFMRSLSLSVSLDRTSTYRLLDVATSCTVSSREWAVSDVTVECRIER